ncbi:MAG: hypothetical protein ACYS9X_29375 [Planctomycetota bacterium]|jgi:hypothetical protein
MGAHELIYALFCEHHSVDANGRNTYTSVFDEKSITIKTMAGSPKPRLPLPRPQPTGQFWLALKLKCAPNTGSCWVQLKDMNGQAVGPRVTMKLKSHPKGLHRVNMCFQNGIPVLDQGVYLFEIGVGETVIGSVELPVNIKIL